MGGERGSWIVLYNLCFDRRRKLVAVGQWMCCFRWSFSNTTTQRMLNFPDITRVESSRVESSRVDNAEYIGVESRHHHIQRIVLYLFPTIRYTYVFT